MTATRAKKSVADLVVDRQRGFVRVDFNVPIDPSGRITDDRRIREAIPTIQSILSRGGSVVLASHLGRPGGKPDSKCTLWPVAVRLEELLGCPVLFVPETVGPVAESAVQRLESGQVALVENLRFCPGEEANDAHFSEQLARLANFYVDDAFGTAHRSHASTVGITQYLRPAVSGLLLEKELKTLGDALEAPRRPLVAVIGGAKISSKIRVLGNLLPRVESLCIGGGMANTFLKALGYEIGRSLVENDQVPVARSILAQAGAKLVLPNDVVVAPRAAGDASPRIRSIDRIPVDEMILDVGPKTVEAFAQIFALAGTVIWNGPLGLAELPAFAEGTAGTARALARSAAMSIVGGGDLVAALEAVGLADRMSHVSTGGGASLEFLEGKELPGVAALEDRD